MAALLAKKAACADAEEDVYESDVETRRQEGGEEGPLSGACGVDSHCTVGDVCEGAVAVVIAGSLTMGINDLYVVEKPE